MKTAEYKNDNTGNRQTCKLIDDNSPISWKAGVRGRSCLTVQPADGISEFHNNNPEKANTGIILEEYYVSEKGSMVSKQTMASLNREQMTALRDSLNDALGDMDPEEPGPILQDYLNKLVTLVDKAKADHPDNDNGLHGFPKGHERGHEWFAVHDFLHGSFWFAWEELATLVRDIKCNYIPE